MPSSDPRARVLLGGFVLLLGAGFWLGHARAYDLEREAWRLPAAPEFERPPREARPFPDPLNFARVQYGGNDRPPEYASGAEAELLAAVARADRPAVERLLNAGANASRATDLLGHRPLARAVRDGDVELVRLLLEAGADPNLKTLGLTPLGLAALRGQTRIARLLLEAGADPNLKGSDGNTPLYNAALLGHAGVLREMMPYRPDFSIVNAGLPGFEGLNALGAAALQGNTEALRVLLDAGADPGLLDGALRPPLFYAVYRRQRAAVLILLEYGAENGAISVDAY